MVHDFEVNVKGFFLMNHDFLEQGGGKRGTTIAINGQGTGSTVPRMSSYVPSKLAQTRATEFLHVGKLWISLLRTVRRCS